MTSPDQPSKGLARVAPVAASLAAGFAVFLLLFPVKALGGVDQCVSTFSYSVPCRAGVASGAVLLVAVVTWVGLVGIIRRR